MVYSANKMTSFSGYAGGHVWRQGLPPSLSGGTSKPQERKDGQLETSLKYSHSDTFNRDSGLIKEARAHYFAMHPWDWTQGNMENLSDIFRGLAQCAGLLDECIFELQDSWRGPDYLK